MQWHLKVVPLLCLFFCKPGHRMGLQGCLAGGLGRSLCLLFGPLWSHGRNNMTSTLLQDRVPWHLPGTYCWDFSEEIMIMIIILILAYYIYWSAFSQRNKTSKRYTLKDLLQGSGLLNSRAGQTSLKSIGYGYFYVSTWLGFQVSRYLVKHYSGHFSEDAFR